MNENGMRQDDEVPLFVLLNKLRAGWLYVLGGSVLGLVGAYLAIVILPPTFEAVAIIQVGQVGQVGEPGQVVQLGQAGRVTSLPVEPPTQAIERMRTATFQWALAQSLGDQAWLDALSRSSTATTKYISLQLVKASVVPGAAPLIELKTRSDNPHSAKKIAEAAVLELAKRQGEIAKPLIEKMRIHQTTTKDEPTNTDKKDKKLNMLLANVGVKDDRFTQLSLITSLRVQKETDAFSHRQTIIAYETALLPPATQPARTIEAVFVGEEPVSPKKPAFLAIGLIGGVLAGMVSAFFFNARRLGKREGA